MGQVKDPRRQRRGNYRHKLTDILFPVFSAVLCGAEDWNSIELFGREQEQWLKKHGNFGGGIPSHDTVNRVVSAISPDELSRCLCMDMQDVRPKHAGEVVAIDGKRIRNSHDRVNGKSALHVVSAWAVHSRQCLGQVATDAKSNEITAIPELLSMLELDGNTVTVDAMGCQKKIAEKIIEVKANYILAVKGNQQSLEEGIEDTCRFVKPADISVDTDAGHGRVEMRKCTVYNDLSFIENAGHRKNIHSIVKIDSERFIKATGETDRQTRYYISSLEASALEFNSWIRQHWAIENSLHRTLDVTFREDYSRKRKGNAARNFNIILKRVMMMLMKDVLDRNSLNCKRFKAALSFDYRERLLNF